MGQIDLGNHNEKDRNSKTDHTTQKNINTKHEQVLDPALPLFLGNLKMNVNVVIIAICALFVMNLELSYAGFKVRAETGPIDPVELTNTFESVVDDDELLLRMDGVADTVISDRRYRKHRNPDQWHGSRGKREIMDGEHQLEDRRYRHRSRGKREIMDGEHQLEDRRRRLKWIKQRG